MAIGKSLKSVPDHKLFAKQQVNKSLIGIASIALTSAIGAGFAFFWPHSTSRTVNNDLLPATRNAIEANHAHSFSTEESAIQNATLSLANGEIEKAEQELKNLLTASPNFRLAHALLGEIHNIKAGLPIKLDTHQDSSKLKALQSELHYRIDALRHPPPPDALPENIIQISPSTSNIIVVEGNRLRLYWFRRTKDGSGKFQLIANKHISVGKAGLGKQVRGDNKTPLGVYRIIDIKTKDALPDFYGAGALVLDYPNAADRLLGRTGSGIWIHGTPSNTFSRDPLASEGCVVLSNNDMLKLMQEDDIIGTPVIIVPEVSWKKTNNDSANKHVIDAIQTSLTEYRPETLRKIQEQEASIFLWNDKSGDTFIGVYENDSQSAETKVLLLKKQNERFVVVDESEKKQSIARKPTPTNDSNHLGEAGSNTSILNDSKKEIINAIMLWKNHWEQKNLAGYLAFYHPTKFIPNKSQRTQWELGRRTNILNKTQIKIHIQSLQVKKIEANRFEVKFIQNYNADNHRSLVTSKRMEWMREGGRWWIVSEKAG